MIVIVNRLLLSRSPAFGLGLCPDNPVVAELGGLAVLIAPDRVAANAVATDDDAGTVFPDHGPESL